MTETTYPIGATIRHRITHVRGEIVGKPVAMRSAGGRIMQRVRWQHGFRQSHAGSFTFVADIEAVEAAS
jgi:hypothetical protein